VSLRITAAHALKVSGVSLASITLLHIELSRFQNIFGLFNPVSFLPAFIADMPGNFARLSN